MALFLAGLPWLAAIIGSFFTVVFGFFLKFFTRKVAGVLAFVALSAAAVAALVLVFEGLLAGLNYALPPDVASFAGLVLPSNFTTCISIIISAKAAVWAYRWNVKIIQTKFAF